MQNVVERWLYPIGIRAEPAFMGEMIRGDWDLHSSRDVVECQQLAEGCWEVAAGVVPPHKNPTGRPPIGYFVKPLLAAECLEALAIIVVRLVA
jgi:hypothetical protein